MNKNILITGGTGLVGSRLSEMLEQKGYTVSLLSRKAGEGQRKKYVWDISSGHFDETAIKHADYIIHLAGAGVFDKRWTQAYKKEIMSSRVDSTQLLATKLATIPNSVKAIVAASAIGIYGFDTGDTLLSENSPFGEGFLAEVCKNWEAAVDSIDGIRTIKMRIGIVLSEKGGALEQMAKPVNYFVGSPLGTGNQQVSWIHLDDMCGLLIFALENEHIKGAYNAVAPNPVTNKLLTEKIAKILKRPLWLPNIPSFMMKLIVGAEASSIILGGNNVSSKKITDSGFKFKFPDLISALTDLLQNKK